MEGFTGGKPPGWPALHESQSHVSPLMYDIDMDGTPDIMLPTYNGHVLFFKDVVGAWVGLCWCFGGLRGRGNEVPLILGDAVCM